MFKRALPAFLILFLFSFFNISLHAQETLNKKDSALHKTWQDSLNFNFEEKDTFFLAKKKGLLGKLGKSLATDPPNQFPVKVSNPFTAFTGKIIRNIKIVRLGFERNINDTNIIRNNLGVIVANGLHKKTRFNVIHNNLFFKVGNKVNPFLLADNERHLRDQVYFQDARIIIENIAGEIDSVDILVLTKDIFSIGGSAEMHNIQQLSLQVQNENLGGSGSRLLFSSLYDMQRNPKFGFGAEMLKRNIKGSFIDASIGFKTFKSAFNSGRFEETTIYTHFEKPLVTPYIPWIGALDVSINRTNNDYLQDTAYQNNFRYKYHTVDGWFGYNFGHNRLLYQNMDQRTRKFITFRGVDQHFYDIPTINHQVYDYRYASVTAVLAAFSIFKQDAYRANFIYGFGRNEDVPEGFSASFIGGWTRKQGRHRPYYGIDILKSHFSTKGYYTTYTFKSGGYMYKNRLEDIDMLFNIDHFTRLKKINSQWYTRDFLSIGYAKQLNPILNQPLRLNSTYGLPFFRYPGPSDLRTTAKAEAVFFNMRKFWGFRLAPFIFADVSVLTPTAQGLKNSQFYSDFGVGVRTRNENLTFGTMELRGYYYPRTLPGMKNYRIEVGTNIRFKYISTFITKPDFVVPN